MHKMPYRCVDLEVNFDNLEVCSYTERVFQAFDFTVRQEFYQESKHGKMHAYICIDSSSYISTSFGFLSSTSNLGTFYFLSGVLFQNGNQSKALQTQYRVVGRLSLQRLMFSY